MKHGAYSPRRSAPLAAALLEQVMIEAQRPGSPTSYLSEPAFRPALVSWSECEARIQLVREWLGRVTDDDPDSGQPGDLDDLGAIRPASHLLLRLESQALKHRERLGLDPLARSRMGRDLAAGSVDMARLMSAMDGAATDVIPAAATDDDDDEDNDDDDG
jgi:hypothetical protein